MEDSWARMAFRMASCNNPRIPIPASPRESVPWTMTIYSMLCQSNTTRMVVSLQTTSTISMTLTSTLATTTSTTETQMLSKLNLLLSVCTQARLMAIRSKALLHTTLAPNSSSSIYSSRDLEARYNLQHPTLDRHLRTMKYEVDRPRTTI